MIWYVDSCDLATANLKVQRTDRTERRRTPLVQSAAAGRNRVPPAAWDKPSVRPRESWSLRADGHTTLAPPCTRAACGSRRRDEFARRTGAAGFPIAPAGPWCTEERACRRQC